MGNKSSKKTESASTAVAKHQFSTSTSYRAQAETAARGQHSPEWVMVLNATAYIHCGSRSNAGSLTNLAVSNGADLLSEQIHSINKQVAVVPRSNALTQYSGSSSHVIGNNVSSRQTIPTGMEALDLVKGSKSWNLEDDLFGTGCLVSKPYRTTSAEIKSLTLQGTNEVQSIQPSCTVRPLKKKAPRPPPTAVVSRSNAVTQHHGSSSHVGNCVLQRQAVPTGMEAIKTERAVAKPSVTTPAESKALILQGSKKDQSRQPSCTVLPLKKELSPPASAHIKSNIPYTKQDVGMKKPTAVVTSSHIYSATKTQAANTCNVVTVYKSAVSNKNVEARLDADRYDWFNTLTAKADEVKQQAMGNVRREPPRLQLAKYNMQPQNERGGQTGDGLVWREVNRAEGGCWYHFRRVAGGGYKCTLCNVSLYSTQSIIEHAWGKFHQACLDKKRLSETEEDLMWRRVPKPEKFHRNYIYYETDNGKPFFYCSICEVEVPFAYQNLLTHIRGRIHREKLDGDHNWN